MINGKINITTQCINLAFHENINQPVTYIQPEQDIWNNYHQRYAYTHISYTYNVRESINNYIISPMYIKYSESSFSLIQSTFQPCHGGRKASLL